MMAMNERDVRLTYRFLGHRNETEIRMIDPSGIKPPLSIFVADEDSFVNVCRDYDGDRNIYVGINERRPRGTKCVDVITVNAIIFDIDSNHPRDVPATDAERDAAWPVAENMALYLREAGHTPFIAMSGNGWQIWVKVEMNLNPDNYKKVEAVIKDIQSGMMDKFSMEYGIVDNIGDLARVIKIIGTTSIKVNPGGERPNRVSRWEGRRPIYVQPDKEWSRKILVLSEDYVIPEIDADFQENIPALSQEQIDKMINGLPPYARAWFDGKYDKFKSRSEAEFALLIFMAENGIPKPAAFSLMFHSKIGKWKDSNNAYRKLTINKAYSFFDKT